MVEKNSKEMAKIAVAALEEKKDEAQEKLYKAGYEAKQVEGYQTANWILMDYQDIIVHIFDEENRLFYDLERIWRDGSLVEKADLEA